MLTLVKNQDKQLVDAIQSGEKHINNFNEEDFERFNKLVANMPFTVVSDLLQKSVMPAVPMLQYDEQHPDWFDDDTQFSDNIWHLSLKLDRKIWKKTIDFNRVVLNDGKKLTLKKHQPLLNTLKKWLVVQGHPLYNGGRILKPVTIKDKLNRTLHLIDALLINADAIKLAQRHMHAINHDLIIDILSRIDRGVANGLYQFNAKLTDYLLNNISCISDEEAHDFAKTYPYLKRPLLADEKVLPLSQEQRIKACCFLFQQGAYDKTNGMVKDTPINTCLASRFFSNTLNGESLTIPVAEQLRINESTGTTEYLGIPVKANECDSVTDKLISQYLSTFKMLGVLNDKDLSKVNPDIFDKVSIKQVAEHSTVKMTGRFNTLPVDIVFKAMKDAFEFAFEYADIILETAYTLVLNIPKNNRQITYNNKQIRALAKYKQVDCLQYMPENLKALGVTQWSVSSNEKDCFALRRQNQGFWDLYEVLIASIQVLVGATMARRQGELLDLHPTDCLLPKDIDPNDKASSMLDFELVFDNRKSGTGTVREQLSKPILRSVAGFIYKLQNFNARLIKAKLIKKNKADLFLHFNTQEAKFSFGSVMAHYNERLDAFCDYFETQTVAYKSADDVRRYYIRQHQLRRFFAMVFFWSSGFDGLDTLREFLGHTDSEHLYHYVTEGIPGEVLASVKARRIKDSLGKNDIENIEKLGLIIQQAFGAISVTFKTYKLILKEYEDDAKEGYIEVQPSIDEVKKQFEKERIAFEQDITRLLLDHTIDLQPEFFTVKDTDGNEIHDYKLVLKVKELE